MIAIAAVGTFLALVGPTVASAQFVFPESLGPMPFHPSNPPTPEKEMLGKFLFWEEQLSSDDSTACATCHIPEFGGGDPRAMTSLAANPGPDGLFGNDDDVRGSVGLVSQTCDGTQFDDGVFFPERQVTPRKAPTMIGAGYAPELFWDGRAGGAFVDPLDGVTVVLGSDAALETQAVGPPLSAVEMACDAREWSEITAKLADPGLFPLALASDLPMEMANARVAHPTYPQMFTWAFGTPDITPSRIAMAIATYERSLVPNQTLFDLFNQTGDPNFLNPTLQEGMLLFLDNCTPCHDSIHLSDHDFHNIGVRPALEDIGREEVTGLLADRGKFKTPGLRNIALRAPYFHNGGKATLDDVLAFYNGGGDFDDNLDPDMVELNLGNSDLAKIRDFLEIALTDPRVENGTYPFDHPNLQPFFRRGDSNFDDFVDIADVIHMLSYIFQGGASPCLDASDANDDGGVDIADPIAVLGRLFTLAPPLPLPSDMSHGPDPTSDLLSCFP